MVDAVVPLLLRPPGGIAAVDDAAPADALGGAHPDADVLLGARQAHHEDALDDGDACAFERDEGVARHALGGAVEQRAPRRRQPGAERLEHALDRGEVEIRLAVEIALGAVAALPVDVVAEVVDVQEQRGQAGCAAGGGEAAREARLARAVDTSDGDDRACRHA